MDKNQIQAMIDASIAKALAFPIKKYGDTPTDANQLVPKKYLSSVVGTPAGSDGTVQFNNNGAFGGTPVFSWNNSTSVLSISKAGNSSIHTTYGPQGVVSEDVTTGRLASLGINSNTPFLNMLAPGKWVEYQDSTTTTSATPGAFLAIPIANNSNLYIQVYVNAYQTGGASGTVGDSAGYVRRCVFKRIATVTNQVGATQDAFTVEDQAGWDVSFTNGGSQINVVVTGEASKNITWYAHITTFEPL